MCGGYEFVTPRFSVFFISTLVLFWGPLHLGWWGGLLSTKVLPRNWHLDHQESSPSYLSTLVTPKYPLSTSVWSWALLERQASPPGSKVPGIILHLFPEAPGPLWGTNALALLGQAIIGIFPDCRNIFLLSSSFLKAKSPLLWGHNLFNQCIPSFSKCFLSTCYMHGPAIDSGKAAVNEQTRALTW